MKVMKKKDKVNALKNQIAHEISERERISERVEFLEKQFTMRTGVGYVKASHSNNDEDEGN